MHGEFSCGNYTIRPRTEHCTGLHFSCVGWRRSWRDRTAYSVTAGRCARCSRRKVSSVGRPLIYRVAAALPIPDVPYHRNVWALNEATMVIVMIESAEALAAVDEIAAVDGVDMLFIGTNDLCSSLGIPGQLDHDSIRDAYARTIEACRRYGKHLGVGGLSAHPKLAGEFVKLGGRYVSTGTDLSFLLSAATTKAKQMSDAN